MVNVSALLGPLHCKKISLVYLKKLDKNISPDIKNYIIKNAAIMAIRYNCMKSLTTSASTGLDYITEFAGTSCLLYYHTKDDSVLQYMKQYLVDAFNIEQITWMHEEQIDNFIEDVITICNSVD